MGKVKDDSNFQIYGWMTNKLKLKGNELLIYAIIYSFSRNNKGEGVFNASIPYLQEWTNIASKNVRSCLKNLLDKQLIIKVEDNYSRRKPNVYKINRQILQGTKGTQTGYETTPVQGTKGTQTGYERYPNNNTIINSTISDEEQALGKVCEMYAKEITDKLYCSPHEVEEIKKLADEHGVDNVEHAIRTAVEYNKKSLAYIKGVLIGKNAKSKKHVELPDEYNIPF